MKGIDMFIGIEAEGRWRGVPTVFVPVARDRHLTEPEDEFIIKKEFQGRHIYFGASGLSLINEEDFHFVKEVIERNRQCCFTVEIALPAILVAAKYLVFCEGPNVRLLISVASYTGPSVVPRLLEGAELKIDHSEGCVVFGKGENIPSDDLCYKEDKKL